MERQNGMVRLVKVDVKSFYGLVKLSVNEAQEKFVASNMCSVAEAYAYQASGRYAQPFGIYDGDTPVGFLMIGYNFGEDDEEYGRRYYMKDSYLLWRLMIDRHQQGKGYGKDAMRLALEFIRTWPQGKAEYCWVSYEPENEAARRLYRSFGFVEQEKPEKWDEVPAVLKL